MHGFALHTLKVFLGVAPMPKTIPDALFAGLFVGAFGFAVAVGATLFLTVEKPLSLKNQVGFLASPPMRPCRQRRCWKELTYHPLTQALQPHTHTT